MKEYNCTTERLIKAIGILQRIFPANHITAIQFEDGSGKKFNYRTNHDAVWHYIDLSKYPELIELV